MPNNKKTYREEKFKADKRELREGAFILYFESLFRDDNISDIYEVSAEAEDADAELRLSEQSCRLAEKVAEKASEIDKIIENYSKKRSVDRIAKINLAILRLALYEAIYEDKVPVNVAISEAVSLAQKYAREPDTAFINGVLGAFSRDNGEKSEVKTDE
ncbi:MAG: transcription antitermination factor NusB [Oscillospiraceae bacterium]